MARYKTSSEQNEAIQNFINNLSDVEVDDNINEESSDDGKTCLCIFFYSNFPIFPQILV